MVLPSLLLYCDFFTTVAIIGLSKMNKRREVRADETHRCHRGPSECGQVDAV